jgi:hypothetical protein
MVCPMTMGSTPGIEQPPIRPPGRDGQNTRLEHRRLQTGAAINKRWRDDVVSAEMLQLLPGKAAA